MVFYPSPSSLLIVTLFTMLCVNLHRFMDSITTSNALINKNKPRPVLLSHIPLYRENDLACGEERLLEKGHVTYEAPDARYLAGHDVLTKTSTRIVMVNIRQNKAYKPCVMIHDTPHIMAHFQISVDL